MQTVTEMLHIWLQRVAEKLQRLTDLGRQVPAKEFHRVSHFNPIGIALTAFIFMLKKNLLEHILVFVFEEYYVKKC